MTDILEFLKENEGVIKVGAIWAGSLAGAYQLGRLTVQHNKRREALQNRFDLIYAPLRTILLDRHISTGRLTLYPKFSQRLRRSWSKLKLFHIVGAFNVLFDKFGGRPTAEIEFGGELPYGAIKNIVKQNAKWADPKLLGLVQWTDRAHYESPAVDDFVLIEEEMELIDHIWNMYNKLNKKLLPR